MRKVFSWIIALTLVSNALMAQSDLSQGIKLIANENYGDATKFFEKVKSAEPKNGLPLYYLGKIQYALEKYDDASKLFNQAALLDKKCSLCAIGSAQMLLESGKTAEADKAFMVLAKKNKKSASTIAAIGDAFLYSRKPDYTKAITYLKQARDIDPKIGSIWAHLGDAYNKNSEAGNAMSAYETAVQKDKSNVEAFVSMGKIWRAGKNNDLSNENFEKAIALAPDFAPAYKELIENYIKQARYSKVTSLLEKYVPLAGTDIEAKVRLVKFLCFQAKDYDRAISEGEALKKVSNDYTINRWIGWSYIEKEKYEEGYQAMKAFVADVDAQPTTRKAFMLDYDYLAKAAMKTNRVDEALSTYEKVFQQDPSKAEEVYTNLAKTYYEAKDYGKAIEYFNKRDNIKTLNNNELYRLGQAYNQVKNYAQAEKAYRRYIELDQSFPNVYYALATVVAKQDPDQVTFPAIADYQKFIEVTNGVSDKSKLNKLIEESYMYIGAGLVKKDDNMGAKAAFESALSINPANADAANYIKILSGSK